MIGFTISGFINSPLIFVINVFIIFIVLSLFFYILSQRVRFTKYCWRLVYPNNLIINVGCINAIFFDI